MQPADTGMDRYVFLIGRPPMTGFIGLMKTMAAEGPRLEEAELSREWMAASDRVRNIERDEAGLADNPEILPLPRTMTAIAETELATPAAQRSFRFLPHRWALVEIDRLIVLQKYVNLDLVDELKKSLSATPTDKEIVELAVARGPSLPPVSIRQLTESSYAFASNSHGLRLLNAKLLDPASVQGFCPSGNAAGLIAIYVGFGLNFINALHVKNRLILSNGTHRAYALRALGITHVPCLVRDVSREEELELVGASMQDLRQNPNRYLHAPRPPLFKDYFNEDLRKIVPVTRDNYVLQVQFSTQSMTMPAV